MLVTKRSADPVPDPEGGLGHNLHHRRSDRADDGKGSAGSAPGVRGTAAAWAASPRACQAALVATQASFCVGAVYLKACLAHIPHAMSAKERAAAALAALKRTAAAAVVAHSGGGGGAADAALTHPPPPPPHPASSFHPVVFAFYREAAAGLILLAIAAAAHPATRPARAHLPLLVSLGLCLYLNQLGYILGVDAAGVVAAACLQPAVPVFTAGLAVLTGAEAPSGRKLAGTALAVAGALAMVAGGGGGSAAHPHAGVVGSGGGGGGGGSSVGVGWGHASLLASTLSTSIYYLLSKRALASYPPLCVAGWAYLPAAVAMGATAFASAPPDAWHLPAALAGPLAYWVLVCSVAGYAAVAWAATRLPASQVAAFTCLQPFLGTALAAGVLGEELSPWDAGAVGVLAGLALVIRADGDGGSGAGGGPAAAGLARTASLKASPRRPASPALPAPPRPAPVRAAGWQAWLPFGGGSKPAVA